MKEIEMDELTYEWPPNLVHYETKVFFGLGAPEAIAGALGFLLPIALVPSVAGFVLGLMGGTLALLALWKLDQLMGLSLPAYLLARLLAARRTTVIELPLILGGSQGVVAVESWEGETLLVLEGEGA